MSWGNRKYHFSEHVSQILLDQCSSKRQDDRVKEAGSHCIVLEDPLVRFLQKFGKYKIIVRKVLINDKRVARRGAAIAANVHPIRVKEQLFLIAGTFCPIALKNMENWRKVPWIWNTIPSPAWTPQSWKVHFQIYIQPLLPLFGDQIRYRWDHFLAILSHMLSLKLKLGKPSWMNFWQLPISRVSLMIHIHLHISLSSMRNLTPNQSIKSTKH